MKSLFIDADRQEILDRLAALEPASTRLWGKMAPAQMMAHCSGVLEMATGISPRKQRFIGKLLGPFVRAYVKTEKEFSKNSPTDPSIVISDERDFQGERQRLIGLIERLVARGRDEAGRAEHPFFGKLSGDDWGVISWKHLDHHLRQFGR